MVRGIKRQEHTVRTRALGSTGSHVLHRYAPMTLLAPMRMHAWVCAPQHIVLYGIRSQFHYSNRPDSSPELPSDTSLLAVTLLSFPLLAGASVILSSETVTFLTVINLSLNFCDNIRLGI